MHGVLELVQGTEAEAGSGRWRQRRHGAHLLAGLHHHRKRYLSSSISRRALHRQGSGAQPVMGGSSGSRAAGCWRRSGNSAGASRSRSGQKEHQKHQTGSAHFALCMSLLT